MEKVIITVGKRKSAIARAYVKSGNGIVKVNSTPIEVVEPMLLRLRMMEPIVLAGEDYVSKVNIKVKVSGGGIMGQADAVRTAIAKGLVSYFDDEKLKSLFINYDPWMLKSDIRRKEQNKSPMSKPRKWYTTAYR